MPYEILPPLDDVFIVFLRFEHIHQILGREFRRQVARGQRVALMGAQGDGRPKLHFEIRRNGVPVDPVRLLPRRR